MIRSSSLLLGLLLATGVASANTTGEINTPPILDEDPTEIIGGTAATAGQFPTVVAITAGGGICTGTIVDRDWVLTAAHCISPSVLGLASQQAVTDSVRVYYNTTTINTTAGRANMRRAMMTVPKPTFNVQALGANDIGLIKLAQPIDGIVPSPINFEAAMAPVGVVVQMAGFGAQQIGGGGNVGVLMFLNSRTSVSCSSLGGGSDANLLCFNQTDAKGKCSGDSGGPSFATINGKPTVVGVTSFGDQNCQQFGADTRTNIEKEFILKTAPVLAGSCTDDGQCNGGLCFKGMCIAQPFSGNGLGVDCMTAANCQSNVCLTIGEDMKCSMACTVGDDSSCPDGFDCLDGGGAGACWPSGTGSFGDDDSGCCDSSGRGGPTALFAFGLLALVIRRRRK
jgi:uncharacterized protein (TIGR03382 family)